jgi:hypothetical protein
MNDVLRMQKVERFEHLVSYSLQFLERHTFGGTLKFFQDSSFYVFENQVQFFILSEDLE